jgi:CRP-like cAMP-binding protein
MDTYQHIKQAMERVYRYSDEQVTLFHTMLEIRTIRKKECLLKAGQYCNDMAIVIKGSLRIYNAEHTLNFFTEHDWVADHNSFVSRRPSLNQIEAMEDTEVALISIFHLHTLIATDPAFIILGRLLADLAITTPLKPPQERYNELMQHHPDWIIRFPQKHLASYLGMTPETFSRMKRKTMIS